MARINNAIFFGSAFNITAASPIDSRMRVEYVADLTKAETWPASEAPVYNGMTVTVMENSCIYVLKNKDGYQDMANWHKIGGDIQDNLNTLSGSVETLSSNLNTLSGSVETLKGADTVDGSIAKSIKDAIEGLDVAAIGEEGKAIVSVSQTDGKVSAATGVISADYVKVGEKTVSSALSEVNDAIALASSNASSALTEAISGVNSTIASVSGDLATDIAEVSSAVTSINNTIGEVTEGKTVVEMITDAQNAAVAASTVIVKGDDAGDNLIISATTTDGAKTYTIGLKNVASASELYDIKTQLEIFLSGETSDNVINTLKEIQKYITEDGEASANLIAQVSANTEGIEAINTKIGEVAEDTTVVDMIAAAQDAVEELEGEVRKNEITIAAALTDLENTKAEKTEVEGQIGEINEYITGINETIESLQDSVDGNANAITEINNTIGTVEEGQTLVDLINDAKDAAIAASSVVAVEGDYLSVEQSGDEGSTQTYTISISGVASEEAVNTLAEEVLKNETVIAAALTDLENTKAEKTEVEAVSSHVAEVADQVSDIEGAVSDLEESVKTLGEHTIEADANSNVVVNTVESKTTIALQWGTF